MGKLDSRNAASVKDPIQIVYAVSTQFLKMMRHCTISNIKDFPYHANGTVLETLFESAAQRAQLLIDLAELGTSPVVIQFVIATDSFSDNVPCLPIGQLAGTKGLLRIL